MVRVLQHFKHANSGYFMPEILYSLSVRPMGCIQNYSFRMNNMKEIFLRLEAIQKFLPNDTKIYNLTVYVLQLIKNYNVYNTYWRSKVSSCNCGLDMYDLLGDEYKAFVVSALILGSIPRPRVIRHLGQLSLPSLRGR